MALVTHDPTATVELPPSKVGVPDAKESPHLVLYTVSVPVILV